jgi:hypothetical protein
VLKKMTVPDNWQRYFCYLSSREALPELATWSRSSFLQSPDATLEYCVWTYCYQQITVCPSVKTHLPSYLKTSSSQSKKVKLTSACQVWREKIKSIFS